MSEWHWHYMYDEAYGPRVSQRRPKGDRLTYPIVAEPSLDWADQGFDGPLLRGVECAVCGSLIVWCWGKYGDWMHVEGHREIRGGHLAQPIRPWKGRGSNPPARREMYFYT